MYDNVGDVYDNVVTGYGENKDGDGDNTRDVFGRRDAHDSGCLQSFPFGSSIIEGHVIHSAVTIELDHLYNTTL